VSAESSHKAANVGQRAIGDRRIETGETQSLRDDDAINRPHAMIGFDEGPIFVIESADPVTFNSTARYRNDRGGEQRGAFAALINIGSRASDAQSADA
jgi:hypothetical protein